MRAAVAVELVHSATLVHDDLIDGAQLRRGHPTVAAAAGRGLAVATGDLLFSRAFAELARNEDAEQLRALSQASSALAAGELLQREDAYASHVAVERYLRRCELKTAALFEAACRLGALTAQGRLQRASRRRWGRSRGASGSPSRCSTTCSTCPVRSSAPASRAGRDLLDGTVTLPFILAREREPAAGRVRPDDARGPEQAEALCERIAATGALEEAREQALGWSRRPRRRCRRSSPAAARRCSTWWPTPSSSATARPRGASARSRRDRSGRRRARG